MRCAWLSICTTFTPGEPEQYLGGRGRRFLFIEGARTARTITRKIEIPDAQLAAALEKGIAVNDSSAAGVLRIVAQDRSTGAAGFVRTHLEQEVNILARWAIFWWVPRHYRLRVWADA